MSQSEELQKAFRMLETAQASLSAAQSILAQLAPENLKKEASKLPSDTQAYEQGETQIIEGYFNGQEMIGPNEKSYPVPANYASKSKLVEGDRLKLTIMPNGSFLYKQIAPIEREFVKGSLTQEDGQFKVIAGGKTYRVLLASVTYYKGSIGDEVTLIIPKDKEAVWGTIEAVIPQIDHESFDEKEAF